MYYVDSTRNPTAADEQVADESFILLLIYMSTLPKKSHIFMYLLKWKLTLSVKLNSQDGENLFIYSVEREKDKNTEFERVKRY